MKFPIKDFLSKCDQICSFLRIWSHLLKKSLMEKFIFCAVHIVGTAVFQPDIKYSKYNQNLIRWASARFTIQYFYTDFFQCRIREILSTAVSFGVFISQLLPGFKCLNLIYKLSSKFIAAFFVLIRSFGKIWSIVV